jgi:hypothetical protein
MPGKSNQATGVIADLFAEEVGFYASWGFSRSIGAVSAGLLTPDGHIDWQSADELVQAALVDTLAAPSPDPPEGVEAFGPELFARVAVGQHCSGWAKEPGKRLSRLVELRCHVGKQRRGDGLANQVLVQYRVWAKSEAGKPRQVLEAARAWPLLEDLHAAIVKRLS